MGKQELFTVSKIIGRKLMNRRLHYKILWEGYPEEQATWEPYSLLVNDQLVSAEIKKFNQQIRKVKQQKKTGDKSESGKHIKHSKIIQKDKSVVQKKHEAKVQTEKKDQSGILTSYESQAMENKKSQLMKKKHSELSKNKMKSIKISQRDNFIEKKAPPPQSSRTGNFNNLLDQVRSKLLAQRDQIKEEKVCYVQKSRKMKPSNLKNVPKFQEVGKRSLENTRHDGDQGHQVEMLKTKKVATPYRGKDSVSGSPKSLKPVEILNKAVKSQSKPKNSETKQTQSSEEKRKEIREQSSHPKKQPIIESKPNLSSSLGFTKNTSPEEPIVPEQVQPLLMVKQEAYLNSTFDAKTDELGEIPIVLESKKPDSEGYGEAKHKSRSFEVKGMINCKDDYYYLAEFNGKSSIFSRSEIIHSHPYELICFYESRINIRPAEVNFMEL